MKKTLLLLFVSVFAIFEISAMQIKNVPFTSYDLNQQQCNGLLHKSGSRIYVPENAFVLPNGQKCGNNITIKYRELRTTLDMVISHTPMIYEDASGKDHTLESGGMFEVYAECNGKELKLNKGKKIQIRFAMDKMMKNLGGFLFDKKKKKWKKINNAIVDYGVETNAKDVEKFWGSPAPPAFEQFSQEDEWGEEAFFDAEFNEFGGWDDFVEQKPEIFKGMDIDEMGLYNYDRILKEEDRIPILANFKLRGIEGKVNKIFVAYTGINSVLYFFESDWKTSFALLPRSDYKIFAVAADGRVAILTDEDKAKINLESLRDKEYTFELELQDYAPESKRELADATGLK